MFRPYFLAGAAAPCLLLAAPAGAQTRATSDDRTDATIVVTGQRDPLKLDDQAQASSRLGLSIRETPASVEVLTQDDLQVRGLRTARETFNDVVGAIAGNLPGNPAVVSMRGFAGNTVSILQDGVRMGAYSGSDETTVRSRLDRARGSGWTLALRLTGYTAERQFLLADGQTFVAPTPAFPNGTFRQSYQDFLHDHRFRNARGVLGNDSGTAGLRNRLSLGVKHNDTDFASLRRTAPATALPAVDVRNPAIAPIPTTAAIFAAGDVTFASKLKQTSVFAEDALNLTPRWLLVGGGITSRSTARRSRT